MSAIVSATHSHGAEPHIAAVFALTSSVRPILTGWANPSGCPGSERLRTTRTVVELSPGRYWAYCGVDGHGQGGMVSRLIVKQPCAAAPRSAAFPWMRERPLEPS
jgi:hypothetical protein